MRKETRDETDRRVDPGTRDRIDVLNDRYQTFAARMLWALTVVGLFAATGIAGGAYLLEEHIRDNRHVSASIQDNRLILSEQSCEATNTEHKAILKVLEGFGVTSLSLGGKSVKIMLVFPITPDCREASIQKLSQP